MLQKNYYIYVRKIYIVLSSNILAFFKKKVLYLFEKKRLKYHINKNKSFRWAPTTIPLPPVALVLATYPPCLQLITS